MGDPPSPSPVGSPEGGETVIVFEAPVPAPIDLVVENQTVHAQAPAPIKSTVTVSGPAPHEIAVTEGAPAPNSTVRVAKAPTPVQGMTSISVPAPGQADLSAQLHSSHLVSSVIALNKFWRGM